MTDQVGPQTATEARAILDARIADKEFGARVLAGNVEARKELADLHAKIHAGGADVVSAAMSGALPGIPSAEQRQMAGVAEMFRDLGIRDEVTSQFLSGQKVSPEEYRLVETWKKSAMNDKAPGGFVQRYLTGDQDARQKMMIANSVLVNGVKESAA